MITINVCSVRSFKYIVLTWRTEKSLISSTSCLLGQNSTKKSLGLAYQWYMACCGTHKACNLQERESTWYPARLVYLGLPGQTQWKVITTAQSTPWPSKYMTLSYCWGATHDLTLTASTLEKFSKGQNIHDLPQTFQDTFTIARRFSISYVWIDSLCVLQDSMEDWEMESSNMREIYANSVCNIAASASHDVCGGLFRSHNAVDLEPIVITTRIRDREVGEYHLIDADYWNRHVGRLPLHKRGWAFQECLLACRVLYFTEDQVFWQCPTETKGETYVLSKIPRLRGMDGPHTMSRYDSSLDLWENWVRHFSRCDLTYPDDKLAAITGLANAFQELTKKEYAAGHWASDIVRSLDWRVYKARRRISQQYRAPSWSWASIDGPLEPCGKTNGSVYLIDVPEVQVSTNGRNPFANVVDGFLRVRGTLKKAYLSSIHIPYRLRIDGIEVDAMVFRDTLDDPWTAGMQLATLALKCYEVHDGNQYQVYSMMGLLLLESSGTYQRVGHFHVGGYAKIREFGVTVDASNWPTRFARETDHNFILR